MRATGSVRMAMRQLQRRKDYEQAHVDTVLQANAIAIGKADPDDTISFAAARQDGLDLIDKMGLDPGIRQQRAKDWFGTAAKARFEALIAKDPKRALEMFGVGTPAASDTAQAAGSLLSGSPKMADGKDDRVGTQTPDERIAQAFRDDLPQEQQDALAQKARVAKLTQEIEIRAAIGRAEAEAPDEIARTGAYSGKIPGEDAYTIIHGRDEGSRRWRNLEWRADVGKRIFDMGTMSNQAIHAALVNAGPGPNAAPADQARHEATAVAAKFVLERRRADSGGYVSELSPDISSGWKAVFGTGPSDPEAFDQDNYDKTLALSVAAQKTLGIEDENLQPVPFSILAKLAEDRDSGSLYFMDNYAKASVLFARTKDPAARAALVRELDDAGLGGILPGGKPRLSVGEVLGADAKALGKTAANAGIFAGKLMKGVGYGISLGSSEPLDFSHGYYEPSNNVEKVMMRQGSDALGWAILGPGIGRVAAAEKAIPRAIESVGSGAAARAEGSIAAKSFASPEGANIPIPEAAPGQIAVEKSKPPAAGEATAASAPKKRKSDFFRQPTSSLDDLYSVSPKWQAELEGAGHEIAETVGAKFVTNGMKERATASEKIGRNGYEDASRLIDIVRVGFVVKNPAQADEIVARLAQRYAIRDGKWFGKENGYFDRKATVRFDDGMLGEVQFWEPNLYKAKFELGGQDLYKRSRDPKEGDLELNNLLAQEEILYTAARRDADPIWREIPANLKVGSSLKNAK